MYRNEVEKLQDDAENGNMEMKNYGTWKGECEKITQIIHEKGLPLDVDQAEVKAVELTQDQIHKISRNEYGKDIQACFKERYLEYLYEQNAQYLSGDI